MNREHARRRDRRWHILPTCRTVAMLRTEAGCRPYDHDVSDLISELSTRTDIFRNRWANHNVRLHCTGAELYHHPVVGSLTLEFNVMELSADDGVALTAFTAADAATSDGLKLLATWAATGSRGTQRAGGEDASTSS